jgi:hypothetical protein
VACVYLGIREELEKGEGMDVKPSRATGTAPLAVL